MYCGDAGAVGHSPSTTEVLHNMPLSIHRHAGYKKNRACDPFQRRERKAKGRCEIFSCLFFTFASHALHQAFFFFVLGGFSFFSTGFHLSTLSRARVTALAVAGTLPVSFTYAWWTVGWSKNPARVTFYQYRLLLATFYPEAKTFRDLFNHLCSEYHLLLLCCSVSSGWVTKQQLSH